MWAATNVSREIAEDEVGCGIMVDYNDVKQIKAAVTIHKDHPLLCRKLGNNGRKAYLQKYNWGLMEKDFRRLIEIYCELSFFYLSTMQASFLSDYFTQ
jgi:glycosyltransferase involved in cell wall biosynthesis